jgi:(p)ppGpp synthase/HD superfamily hydrolase
MTRARDFYDLDVVVEVRDLKHLNRIMQDLRSKPLVNAVSRMTG